MKNEDKLVINDINIQNKIYNIRGLKVMLDRDLALLYGGGGETRALKQAIKRNIQRFPEDFMFILSDMEINIMVSQNVIPSKQHLGGSKPYAFTEQGVSMLSSVLKSKIATDISINIFRAFVNMRKLISTNNSVFQRLETLEQNQLITNTKIDKVFKALESKQPSTQSNGIFFNGQIFDAYTFISDLIRSAKKDIILIDNYIDDSTLNLFAKVPNIKVTIYTHTISKTLKTDLEKYNKQYSNINIKIFKDSHDRFIILDNDELYNIGASLKDVGKKWFAFSKLDISSIKPMIEKLD